MLVPTISVIIPVKNEAGKIRACLDGIMNQSIQVLEIIVIDSGSSDGTQEIVKEYEKVKLLQISSDQFNHGTTRNLGMEEAKGDYVLFTVGDARAADKRWIEELLSGFTNDSVAGVCGLQVVPHEKDKNPVEWFRPVSKPEMKLYKFESESDFLSLSSEEKMQVCGWDDVSAMYKTSIKKKIPFQKITYGEDALWAREALLAGYSIVYNNRAIVLHYHLEDEAITFKKSLTTMYFRYKMFGYKYEMPKLSIQNKLSIFKILIVSLGLDFIAIVKWYRYNISNFKSGLRAYKLFFKAVQHGDEQLDELHAKYCGTPPIPIKQN